MKKTLVAQTVAALIGSVAVMGGANAYVVGPAGAPPVNTVAAANFLEANPNGIGHILLVPYYSAQGGNDTYINLVNTDMRNGKAVKVRFRGASNSDDVLDFTVYLSPGDHWSATITKPAGQDLPIIKTSDKSCTQPAIPAAGQSFIVSRLHPNLPAADRAGETREGYVEIFNMADIPPTAAPDATAVPPVLPTLYTDIEHVTGTPRASTAGVCASARLTAVLNSNPVGTTYAQAQALGFEVPTSGLMANWAIINVPLATSWSGQAWAVEARVAASGAHGYGNIVFFPQVETAFSGVAITAAEARERTADPLLRGGNTTNTAAELPGAPAVNIAPYDLPDMSTPYLNGLLAALPNGVATKTQAYLLTNALASSSVANEYVTNTGVLAGTDWTFTMPTRRYNVARAYTDAADLTTTHEGLGRTLYTNLTHDDAGGAIVAPVATADYFVSGANIVRNTLAGKRHQLCVTGITLAGGAKGLAAAEGGNRVSPVTIDREETRMGVTGNQPVFSPSTPGVPPSFCGEASVLAFNKADDAASTLGASVARRNVGTDNPDGWIRISTPGVGGLGLPLIGYNFIRFQNLGMTPPTTYGFSFQHRVR